MEDVESINPPLYLSLLSPHHSIFQGVSISLKRHRYQNGCKGKGKGKARPRCLLMMMITTLTLRETRPSSSSGIGATSVAEDERYVLECLSRIQPILSNWVQVEVMNALQTHFHPLLESLRERREGGEEAIFEGGIEKFKLVFCNQPPSTIFTNNEIKAENGEALVVAICDATTNAIIRTGRLASALVGLVVVNGDYDETNSSLSELSRNILSPRDGKRPLLVGNGIKLNLENGVAFIKCVSITDNSSWMKSKKFRLVAKFIDEKVLAMFPTVGFAVSQSFRVMDHRGEVNKKHHPPSREDEVGDGRHTKRWTVSQKFVLPWYQKMWTTSCSNTKK
ncbi:Calmodulin-binding protein 60 G, partial [Cucurbita argyrosperma subsp. argyrosperma]